MEWVILSDLRGGRNGANSPIDPVFPETQVVEALNMDYSQMTMLGRKRAGSTAISLTGGSPFTVPVTFLARFVPGETETAAELFALDASGLMKRLAPPGTAWANVLLDDPVTGSKIRISSVTFNGKLYLAYDSGVDRLHVYDPTLAVPRVRRVGFAAPGVATVANSGSGTYAATARRYRIRWYQSLTASGTRGVPRTAVGPGPVARASEPGPESAVFTPSGSGLAARITRPTPPGEGETHWGVEVSLDGVLWYVLAAPNADVLSADAVPIATTIYDDAVVTTSYSTYPLSEELGTYTTIPSVKFLITDNNRMIMAGNFVNGLSSRVYYTPVLGSGLGDAERLDDLVDTDPFTDLNEKDGGAITGLGGPLPGGVIFAFKQRQIWRGVPTGNNQEPYNWQNVTRCVGAMNHSGIALGEDAEGKPALYFISLVGPYRLSNNGLEYLGRDIEDVWYGYRGFAGVGVSATINYSHAVWHADQKTMYWYVSARVSGSAATPNVCLTLNARRTILRDEHGVRGGWARHFNPHIDAYLCSCMFSREIGALMSTDLKPYVGLDLSTPTIIRCDDALALDDDGADFQAYILTKSIMPTSNLGTNVGVRESVLCAEALAGCTLTQALIRDFGLDVQTSTVLLTPEGAELDVIRKFEGSSQSDMGVLQIQIGDAAPAEGRWNLGALMLPVTTERTK